MNDTICIAALTGPGVEPLNLEVIKVSMSEDYTFTIKSYWDDGVDFFEALHRKYDDLCVTWHKVIGGTTSGAARETSYRSYSGFNITGDLTAEDGISITIATIVIQPREGAYA